LRFDAFFGGSGSGYACGRRLHGVLFLVFFGSSLSRKNAFVKCFVFVEKFKFAATQYFGVIEFIGESVNFLSS
jgi:hypothetical protein